jgi:hypothetical protein
MNETKVRSVRKPKPLPEHKLTCGNCLAFASYPDEESKNSGQCRRVLLGGVGEDGCSYGFFPPILSTEWCLAHRLKCDA